jgi:hypothetical protein
MVRHPDGLPTRLAGVNRRDLALVNKKKKASHLAAGLPRLSRRAVERAVSAAECSLPFVIPRHQRAKMR